MSSFGSQGDVGDGWDERGLVRGDRNREVPADDDFAVLDLRGIPADERHALANILQQAVDRLGDAGWSREREDAVMRELLRTHMRGLIGDAARRAGGTGLDPTGEANGFA